MNRYSNTRWVRIYPKCTTLKFKTASENDEDHGKVVPTWDVRFEGSGAAG
jgi:hypothetical protein